MNKRYGMSIDIDKCTGCGACMVACAVENNVPPANPGATERRGITWMRVYKIDNGEEYPERRSAFVPMMCQQCGVDTPCAHVCPQQAVDVDPATGIVGEIPARCLGCRYCVAACPYHARYFNWWDPAWPAGMEKTLNPDVAPRMRGVVEKCNFCHGRWHRAKERAAAAGQKDLQPGDYIPACVEACPAGAIRFGDLNDRSSELAAARQDPGSFRLLKSWGPIRRSITTPSATGCGKSPTRPGRAERRTFVDKEFIARGVKRCSTGRFLLWIAPWAALLAFGLYSAGLCLVKGLNQTNMDNRFAFGLWIFLDLTVIALGAGAFFTGFLLYILKLNELKAVINSAVVIGLVCYSGAVAVLAVDVGQPLRFWFTFWYPNVHSMLTEVTFCISCYLTVLMIEYLPIVLKNRKLREVPSFLVFQFELHKLVYVLAGVGTFLSFFHQGLLGGLYGVLRGRPFAFREGLALWPSTFFLFILSAAAVGPSFMVLTTHLVEKISRKRLVAAAGAGFAGTDLRAAAGGLRIGQDHRHAGMDQPHVARNRIPGVAVLQLAAVRHVDSVCRDRFVRPCAGADSAAAAAARATRLAGFGGGHGLFRRGPEPLCNDRADAGAADAVIRPVPLLLAKLAGDRDVSGGCGIWRASVFVLFPICATFSGGAGVENGGGAAS